METSISELESSYSKREPSISYIEISLPETKESSLKIELLTNEKD